MTFLKSFKTLFAAVAVAALTVLSLPTQAADLTNYAENKVVDALLRGQAIGAPATFYVALFTAGCGDTGGGTEVSGGSYARVAVASSLANWAGTQSAGSTTASSGTGGTTSNNATISFPTPSAGWGTVVSVGWMDASTAGNAWICTTLTVNKTINTGDAVSFPAASLTFQIDN
jgi:hypothetical protein